MWRRKMAARFSGGDGDLNTGECEYFLYNTSNELALNRSQESVDTERRSCDDHSILAIFEDSTASESTDNVEEESEILLSALTEMLDSVEEDEDQILSPFSILQDSELLGRGRCVNNFASQELSPSRRLRSRVRPQNESFKVKSDEEKHKECKSVGNHLPKMLEAKVEVFNSMSLVSLVNLMHPYCLKLEVETEDTPRKSQSLFSQEEVWRYEQPTEESDEEINVVSDDEAPVNGRKEGDAGQSRDKGRLLKSVLMNGNTSRERKRVSFGPVQVASFDESVALKSIKTPETAGGSTLEPSILINDRNLTDAQRERENKREKVKSLSLQEYRQLRQNKRPLVEKQGNYTTKWPSVSEPPKELTPILCFQKHNDCKLKMSHFDSDLHKPRYEAHHHTPILQSPRLHHSRLKSSRTESKTDSPASPLPGDTADPKVLEGKRSPVKKKTLRSIDPPNPVVLPLPVVQTASPKLTSKSRVEGSRCLQETQNESAPQRQAMSSELKSHLLSVNKDFNLMVTLPQEIKASNTSITGSSVSSVQTESVSNSVLSQIRDKLLPKSPPSSSPDPVQPMKCLMSPVSQCPPPVEAPIMQEEELPHVVQNNCPSKEPSCPQADGRDPSAAVSSGIEAPDLTSLLEQFEETQALEDKIIETESRPVPDTSDLSTRGHVDGAAGSERTSSLQLKPSVGPLEPLSPSGNVLDLQPGEPVHVPEPLCTEVVLISNKQPTRRKNPPSKSIQIIDPRPLPPKKTQAGPAEPLPAHCYSYLSLDHDYCRSGDPSHVSMCIGMKSSKRTTEQQLEHLDSAPEEGKNHTQYHPEQFWTSSESLQFTGREDGDTSKAQIPQSILPTPPPSPPVRGRDKRRYRRRSPSSDSCSRSCSSSSSSSSCSSCSPKRRRIRRRRSESSSCSSSPSSFVSRLPPRRYRLSYSRSWSRSRSPSQSRSPSPQTQRGRWREVRSSRESRKLRREHEIRVQKLKAIDERRVVYVGRIRKTMTHNELRERFSQFGEVECVSLHFRDRGDHYGFVTFYNMEDAFAAIDNGGKLRKPDELPFDICFGGRRQFCNSDYADLDANREADSSPSRSRIEDLDFDSLLKAAQRGLKR